MTHLAVVALKVIILIHRHDPEDLFTALRHTHTHTHTHTQQEEMEVVTFFGTLKNKQM